MSEDQVNGFSVCALLYGDHTQLANRCLGSIVDNVDPQLVRSVRVGMNAVTANTRRLAIQWLRQLPPAVQVLLYDAGDENRLKYPMMRRMFHTPGQAIVTPYTMWFDDDSCLAPDATAGWWGKVHAQMQYADMLGAIYRMPIQGQQALGIQAQSWYADKMVPAKDYSFTFATGGWWTIRTQILQRWDYPFADIVHNGGDTALGELMRQQGYRLRHFNDQLWINADTQGRASKAPRRGESRHPVWYHFPATPEDRADGMLTDVPLVVVPYDPRVDQFSEWGPSIVTDSPAMQAMLQRRRTLPEIPGL